MKLFFSKHTLISLSAVLAFPLFLGATDSTETYSVLESPLSIGYHVEGSNSSTHMLKKQISSPSKKLFQPQLVGIEQPQFERFLDDITISGMARILTIYRNMDKSYDDMLTSDKNFSFTDYPLLSVGNNVNGGFPMLELNMLSKISPKFDFNIGYSFSHNLTGLEAASSRMLSSRSNLRFSGMYKTPFVKVGTNIGGILWTSLSRFTMGQAQYRDSYFDRLPWDWYRSSFLRYEEYYSLSRNIGTESKGNSPLVGATIGIEVLPLGVKLKALYGRTNTNVPVANMTNHFPSVTYGARLEKMIFTRYVAGNAGFNYHTRKADDALVGGKPDNTEMMTADFNLKIKKINFAGEVGMGRVQNAKHDKTFGSDWGNGFSLKTELDRDITSFPMSLEYYNIDIRMVSLDGSILSSNQSSMAGGAVGDYLYDLFLHVNIAQEVDQIANNRQGLIYKFEKNFGKLVVQIGAAASQELNNYYDTITFQHRVNAFSRSRFRPWYNAGGNYGRLKSNWMRTFETLTITDEANGISTDYKKGFNALELLLKYKLTLFNRDLVLLNFNSYTTAQDGFSVLPVFDDKAFIRSFFEDFTAAYKLGKNYSIVGHVGLERAMANNRTQLSTVNNKPLDQTGTSFALGIDYDFSKTAGIHLRHRWMHHEDKNFVLDEFKGRELTFEFKLFF